MEGEEVKGDEGRMRRRQTSFLKGFRVGCRGSGLSVTHSVSLFLFETVRCTESRWLVGGTVIHVVSD